MCFEQQIQRLRNGDTPSVNPKKKFQQLSFVCECIFIISKRATLWAKIAAVIQFQSRAHVYRNTHMQIKIFEGFQLHKAEN